MKYRGSIRVFVEDYIYALLKLVLGTLVIAALILIAAFVLPMEQAEKIVFGAYRQVIVEWSILFPFFSVLMVEMIVVFCYKLASVTTVWVDQDGVEIHRMAGKKEKYLFADYQMTSYQEQKHLWKQNKIYSYLRLTDTEGHVSDRLLPYFAGESYDKLFHGIRSIIIHIDPQYIVEEQRDEVQTKPFDIVIPKEQIYRAERRSLILEMVLGIAVAATCFALFYFREVRPVKMLLLGIGVLIVLIYRIMKNIADWRKVPERIMVTSEYLYIDGKGYWLPDVTQISMTSKVREKDMDDRTRWYIRFYYRGERQQYWLGTEDSFSEASFDHIKQYILAAMMVCPQKVAKEDSAEK